jgi:phenylacetate-coenzyme A ligase PaaK-like adenylate-forming protein
MKINPLYNPSIALPLIKQYLRDPGRIERLSSAQLERYQDKVFKKLITYAYTVPLYNKKYQNAGVHQKDINKIKDITKLPLISRQDFRDNFPDGVLPITYDKKKGHVVCTGGTTGKYCCNSGSQPLCIYTDIPTILGGIGISLREHHAFQLNWRTARIAHLGNFNPFKIDEVVEKQALYNLKSIFSFDNYLSMNASDPIHDIIKRLDEFKPDVIISYPAIFQELAFLKTKGYGQQIHPQFLSVGGEMLDAYTRWYVENAFGCKMYNVYASCEAGANIAFECTERNWHVHSDFFYIEAVDKNNELVAPGERGRIVLTRLWSGATPIIRYTGMEDWITLSNGRECGCGLRSPIFEKPVEGRVLSNIVLPNGTIYPPSMFLFITSVLIDFKTYKVKKFQIIQKTLNEIEILLVIDNDLRHVGPSVEEIIKRIEKTYTEKVGPAVKIVVKETDDIPDDPTSGKPAPLVISLLTQGEKCNVC